MGLYINDLSAAEQLVSPPEQLVSATEQLQKFRSS